MAALLSVACAGAMHRNPIHVESTVAAPTDSAILETARLVQSSVLAFDTAGGGRLTLSPVAGRYSPGDARSGRLPLYHTPHLVHVLVSDGVVRGTCSDVYLWNCPDTGARYFLWIASPVWLAPDTLGVEAKLTELPWPWRVAEGPEGLFRRAYSMRFAYAGDRMHLVSAQSTQIIE